MIGESYIPVVTLREIERRAKEALDHCSVMGVVKEFEYDIQFDSTTQEVLISLVLTPGNSVENISATARLNFDLGGDA
jgi:hypothetical protein